MPSAEGTERHRALDGALERGTGLGDTQVQRVVALRGQLPVGLHHDHGVVVLDGDLDVTEAVLLEQARLPQGGLDQRLGRGLAVLLHEPLVERTGVDADADRDARGPRRLRDLRHAAVELLDVAGVHAHRGAAGVDRGEDVLRLEVDIGDDRDVRLLGDDRQRVGVLLAGAGDAHDVAARRRELGDLLQRRVHVVRLGGAHGLHRDRVVAADTDAAHVELTGLAARGQRGDRGCRHSQTYGHSLLLQIFS
ncbi:hypothetical protein MTP03_18410 [Tsukamurella sp. PLM1]|nr:hypothetical protein MTP03_18410 [Tsukamurella sp. PLM1]